MKLFLGCIFLNLAFTIAAQSHMLTVVNGYGSGNYNTGDTVNIWSEAFHGRSYFATWSGDTILLNDPLDWHTRLVMPDQDVTVEADIRELPTDVVIGSTHIQAVDTLKDVWFGFPTSSSIKGVVWLFHGTNGSGRNWFVSTNMFTVVKRLLAAGYATVSLDCEEQTYDEDFNLDGVFRWDYGFDSLQNVDLRNVKAIRDSLIASGLIDASIPNIAYGYSAGGSFATHIATQLGWRAGVTHNAAGVPWVAEFGWTPILYSMTANDNHPDVGTAGNIQAEANFAELTSRGICSEFHLTRTQPLYPERFARDSTISLALSEAIFNELKNNAAVDENNSVIYTGDQLAVIVSANPFQWPVILSLTTAQQLSVGDELDESYATHRFNSDLFGSDLRFIEQLCGTSTAISEPEIKPLEVFPNPASRIIFLPETMSSFVIFNSMGKRIKVSEGNMLDISELPSGMYVIASGNHIGRFIKI